MEERKLLREFAAKVSMGDSTLYRALISILTDINVKKKAKEAESLEELSKYIADEYSVSLYEVENFFERFLEKLRELREQSLSPKELYLRLGMFSMRDLIRLGREEARYILSLADNFEKERALEILNVQNAHLVYIIAASNAEREVMERAYELIDFEELSPPSIYVIGFLHRILMGEEVKIKEFEPEDSISRLWKSIFKLFDSLRESKEEFEKVDLEELFRKSPWAYSLAKGHQHLLLYFQGKATESSKEVLEMAKDSSQHLTARSLLMTILLNTLVGISEEAKFLEWARGFSEMIEGCANCPLRVLMAVTLMRLKAKGIEILEVPKWFLEKEFPGIKKIYEIKRAETLLKKGENVEFQEVEIPLTYFKILSSYCMGLKKLLDKEFGKAQEILEKVAKELSSRGYFKKEAEVKLNLVKCLIERAKQEELDRVSLLNKALEILDELKEKVAEAKNDEMLGEILDYREMIQHLIWSLSRKYR